MHPQYVYVLCVLACVVVCICVRALRVCVFITLCEWTGMCIKSESESESK